MRDPVACKVLSLERLCSSGDLVSFRRAGGYYGTLAPIKTPGSKLPLSDHFLFLPYRAIVQSRPEQYRNLNGVCRLVLEKRHRRSTSAQKNKCISLRAHTPDRPPLAQGPGPQPCLISLPSPHSARSRSRSRLLSHLERQQLKSLVALDANKLASSPSLPLKRRRHS